MTCAHCQAETADGIHLCDLHEGDLWNLLGTIPDTLTEADNTIARQDTRRGTGRGQAGTAPVNLEALQRVTELQELLTSWSRLVHETTSEPGDTGADYLRRHLRVIIRHDWAGDMLTELDHAHRRVVACIDIPPEHRTYGPCHNTGCPGTIRGAHQARIAKCSECRSRYDAATLMQTAIANAWDEKAPLARICAALDAAGFPTPQPTAHRWEKRGDLSTPWADHTGRPLYTMAQVWEARGRLRARGRE